MNALSFQKATKQQSRLRMALIGPSGSGKTYTGLAIASHLGNRIAVIDSERGSASKYSDKFEFDVLNLDTFSPLTYVEAINAAEAAGYDVLLIDSLSHAWSGKDGALEQVDKVNARSKTSNSFGAWREVTPMHNKLVDAMLNSRMHILATMRAKTEYVQEKDEHGKTVIRKVGLQPVQRDGLEYEFDVVADIDQSNTLIIGKTRCSALWEGIFKKAGSDVAEILNAWLSDGEAMRPTDEIRRLCKKLGYTDVQLHKWLVKTFSTDESQSLTAALNSLTEAEVNQAIDTFKLKLEEKGDNQ